MARKVEPRPAASIPVEATRHTGERGVTVKTTTADTQWPPRRHGLPLNDAAQRWLPAVKRRLVERFAPERIVLFGSQVEGNARWDSDLDLLIVLTAIDDPQATRLAIRRALRDIPMPKDIFVTTPEQASRFGPITGTVLYPALHDGATIYVRR